MKKETRRTVLVSFQCGTQGLREHSEFIKNLDKNNGRIVHAYTLYHDYSNSHKPNFLNYVVEYTRINDGEEEIKE
jgi:hypothetical protein